MIPRSNNEIAEGADELVQLLEAFAASQAERPVLFYQEDEYLLFVSRNRERLRESFRFVMPGSELVEDLVDKARFQVLAEGLQLPVPRARRVEPRAGVAPELGLRFPVIAKPLRRRHSWGDCGYQAKAICIATPQALRDVWPEWVRHGLELLVQELVSGPESCIESYHVYVDRQGTIAGEFTGQKIRTFPAQFGYSTALTITDAVDVRDLGRSVVDRLRLRGVAKLDFKRDPQGKLHLLEVNARFNLWHHLGAAAGVNLPELVFRDLLSLPQPEVPPQARAGARWCRLSDDWRVAVAAGIPLRAWLTWALRCEATSVTWSDPLPTVHTLWKAASRRIVA
jgi:predicted ATP-grasp superfamily ATP-dependent carboligase